MRFFRFFPAIGLVLFPVIIYLIGIERIFLAFISANTLFLLIAFLFFLPIVFLQVFKWHFLLKEQGIDVPFGFAAKVFLIGNFYAAITPGKLGSFMRIPYIRKKSGKSLLDCSVNVLLDRVLDVFSLTVLALAGIGFLPVFAGFNGLNLFLLSFFILLAVLFFLRKNASKALNFLYNSLVPDMFKSKTSPFLIKSELAVVKKSSFFILVLLSLLAQLLVFLQSYFIALAFGILIPLHFFVSILAFSSIIVLIPISIQGIGTREAVLLYMFSFFYIEPSKTVVFSVASLFVLYVFVIMTGGYFSIKEKL